VPIFFPCRVVFEVSSLVVKTSVAEVSGTPLIYYSCFFLLLVRTLLNSESAVSSNFVTGLSVLLVRGVLPRAIADIFCPLYGSRPQLTMHVLVVNGDERQKYRDTRREHREQNKMEGNISQERKDSLKAGHGKLG
jgi:hypothetical protein